MLRIHGDHFEDEQGRFVQARGVNLGGSSKVPARPDGATWRKEGFYDHRRVSFVGRPFPLNEAGEHLRRLRRWGFTLLRLLVTWEAVEHAGPGIYDQEYLDYLTEVVKLAGEYGFDVLIDPHQDVWSRFTGGDGAPGWTLEAAGMDATKLHPAGAALLHQESGENFPAMIWPTNLNRLGAATMFTLFFGGRDFAPQARAGGVSIQDFLQDHFLGAIQQVVQRLKGLPQVVGYEIFNEPHSGWIGAPQVSRRAKTPLLLGESPTIFQAMLLGAGYPQAVDVFALGLTGFVRKGQRVVNPGGVSVWREGAGDIWRQHGIWGLDAGGRPRILIDDYFRRVGGRVVDFYRDYYKPFTRRFAAAIRAISPDTLLFVEGVPQEEPPPGELKIRRASCTPRTGTTA